MRKAFLFLFGMLLTCTTVGFSQNSTISGTVSDENGEPLVGATVRVEGTSIGAITDLDGRYVLNDVPSSAERLIVSYVGYDPASISITSSTINVEMTSGVALDNVIVIGYGEIDKRKYTGSYTNIKSEEVENSQFANIEQTLQGLSPGLQVIAPSGAPGSNASVILRGQGSLSAETGPLWVIDGIPVVANDNSQNTTSSTYLAGINPADVMDIQVLKDASATAIFGSRGSNGVILLTTKKGAEGKTKVRLNTEWGFQDDAFYDFEVLDGAGYVELLAQGLFNTGSPNYPTLDVARQVATNFSRWDGTTTTNWSDEVRRSNAIQANNVLSVSGGNDKTNFYLSGSYYKNEPLITDSEFDRQTAALRVNHSAGKLQLGMKLSAGFFKQVMPSESAAFRNPSLGSLLYTPTITPYNSDGSYNVNGVSLIAGSNANPLVYILEDDEQNLNQTYRGSVDGTLDIVNGLKFTSAASFENNITEETQFQNDTYGDARNQGGRAIDINGRFFNWSWANYLGYANDFLDERLELDATIGMEAQEYEFKDLGLQVIGFSPGNKIRVPDGGSTVEANFGNVDGSSFVGYFARTGFTFDRKYTLSGSFRRDGSSRFGTVNRFGDFWSVGAGWDIAREDFISNTDFINTLKLRASIGEAGNADGIGLFAHIPKFASGVNYGGIAGGAVTQVANPGLAWEVTQQTDIGLDFDLFEGRIGGSVDWYLKESKGLLFNSNLSRTGGYPSVLENLGNMDNTGVEVALRIIAVNKPDLNWTISPSFSSNKNEVKSLAGGLNEQVAGTKIIRVGESIRTWYMRDYAGVDPNNGDPLWYVDETKTTTTNNGNLAARVTGYGESIPPINAALTNSIRYRGFTLSALMNYAGNFKVYDQWAFIYDSSGGFGAENKLSRILNNTWTPENKNAKYPKYVFGGNNNANRTSSRYLYDGDYIRLRDVKLQFAFPPEFFEKLKLQGLDLYLHGTNLATWTFDDDLYFDPETGLNGLYNLTVPQMKAVTMGANITF